MLSHVHSPTRPSPGLSRLAMRLAASAKSGPAIAARVCPEALRSNLNVVLITSSKEGKPNDESLHVSREFRSVCRAAHSIDSQIEHGKTASASRAGRWANSSPAMHARDSFSCVLSCAAEFQWLWAAAQRPRLSGAHGEGLRTRHVPAAGTQTTANLCAAPRRQTAPSLTYHTPNSTVPHISHEHSV